MEKCPILGVWAQMGSFHGRCYSVSAGTGVLSVVLRRCEEPTGDIGGCVPLELLPIAHFHIIPTLHDVWSNYLQILPRKSTRHRYMYNRNLRCLVAMFEYSATCYQTNNTR